MWMSSHACYFLDCNQIQLSIIKVISTAIATIVNITTANGDAFCEEMYHNII